MITRSGRFLVILSCALAACNGSDEQNAEHQVSPADTPSIQNSPHTGMPSVSVPDDTSARTLTTLPQQKQDSIGLEGTMHPITLKLVHMTDADPPFTTYMPNDFVFEQKKDANGADYHFYTAFAGKRNNDAYVLLHVFPAATTREAAIAAVKAWVASRATVEPAGFETFQFRKNNVLHAAGIDLRQHANRFYFVARQYPIEMADGFGPRAAKIIDNWHWLI
jgi:hypothetical protein